MFFMNTKYTVDRKYLSDFIQGGRALFTVENQNTGNHFTYKVTRARGDNPNRPWFVSLMTGPDNESSYSYIGVFFPDGPFRWTSKSRVDRNAVGVRAFAWLYNTVINGRNGLCPGLPEGVRVLHHGRCGCCNRVLTTPRSIEIGIGPVCLSVMF